MATVKKTNKKGGNGMDEKKEDHKDFGMCFDNMGAEELKKLMGKEGIGSLCKEMMSKMMTGTGTDTGAGTGSGKGESVCEKFMKQMMGGKEKTEQKHE
jgi:hypothetical protein